MADPISIGLAAKIFLSFASLAWSVAMKGFGAQKPIFEKPDDMGRLVNTRSTDEVVRLSYGKVRVGGNQVFATTTDVDNKFLHLIVTLGEGELNGVVQADSIDQIFLNDKLYTESDFTDNFYYEFFNGSDSQSVCSTLFSAYPDWTDPLRYTSYLYCRFEYDRDKFVSIPTITVVLEALKVKDFSVESQYDDMPMIYTNNLAYCVYDIMTRSSVRGGKGLDPTRIDLPSFREAADYYATYGWTCNMSVERDQSIEDNIASLLVNGRSEIIYSEGKFKLKFRDTREESVCMQIGEDDIIQYGKESTMEITPASTLFRRPNAINATFISKDKNYHIDEKIYRDDDAYDNEGDYRELNIELLGLSSLDKVIPMSYYYLERERWGNAMNMVVSNKGLPLESMDLIEITHRMPGWTEVSKPMYRVEMVQLQENGNVALALLQEHDDLYNDDYDIDTQELFYTSLLSPSAPVQPVINVSHSEEVYYYRDRSFTRWKIDFDPPSVTDYPFWDYAEIWLKIGSGGYRYMTKATSDYQLDPVEEGETYYIKIRSVSIFGVKEDFDSAYTVSKQIVGKTDVPSDMTAITAVASGDTINIYGNEVDDPDISGYEIRLGSAWVGGIFIAFNETPNFRLSGIKPGTFTFWCCPKDNSGNYAATPVSSTVTVFYPSGYTDKNTWSWDYNGIGSHDNTEYLFYGGHDCLKCSHTADLLVGTWTSPEYDLGSEKTVRVWGDFVTVFASSAVSWAGIFPGSTKWEDKIDANTRWYELTTPDVAAILEAKIKWGTATGVYPNETDFFQILSPEFTARYLQVEIKITDPQADANLYVRKLNMKAAYWS
jgi:hypothetical protein